MRWSDRQAGFGAALLKRGAALPRGLVGPDGKPSERRFAVYQNNVLMGLANGLGDAYPVVRRLVGEEFFRAMAVEFVCTTPPSGPMMHDYGAGFDEFLEAFEPVKDLPYLADVARLERCWTESYHAAEQPCIGAEALQGIAPAEIESVRLRLHTSLRIVVSDFPVVRIWQANLSEGEPDAVDLARGGETALVARPGAEVELRCLPGGAAQFILSLAAGYSLGAAADLALLAEPSFDIAAGVRELFALGLVTGFELGASPP